MNDPRRLLESDANPEERALLQAGAREEPPVDGARQLAVSLGMTLSATAAVPSVTHAKAISASGPATKLGLKLLLCVAAGAVVTGASLLVVSEQRKRATEVTQKRPDARSESRPSQAPTSLPSDALSVEAALLERARSALARGASHEAGQALASYQARFANGVLRQEALLLSLRHAMQQERSTEAKRFAQELVRSFPDSPHAVRAREWLNQNDGAADAP